MIILGIESSCDDTSAAVLQNDMILSNEIATQKVHQQYGGVVPEIASRKHIEAIYGLADQALLQTGLTRKDIDAVAVTYAPGLIGAVLVGVNFAKALAYRTGKPLIAVNHIYGHIASNYLSNTELEPPFICLLVSGGHTAIIKVEDYNNHTIIGTTLDDAVGESFDKVARVLGLGYPGGPKVSKLAESGKASIQFAKPNDTLGYNFSFSGKKTAVINYIHKLEQANNEIPAADICASFETWVVDELVEKTIKACKESGFNKIVVAGGVSANTKLRKELEEKCKAENISCFVPKFEYCTDNAAMIGSAAYYAYINGVGIADMTLAPKPNLSL